MTSHQGRGFSVAVAAVLAWAAICWHANIHWSIALPTSYVIGYFTAKGAEQ